MGVIVAEGRLEDGFDARNNCLLVGNRVIAHLPMLLKTRGHVQRQLRVVVLNYHPRGVLAAKRLLSEPLEVPGPLSIRGAGILVIGDTLQSRDKLGLLPKLAWLLLPQGRYCLIFLDILRRNLAAAVISTPGCQSTRWTVIDAVDTVFVDHGSQFLINKLI